MSWREISAKVGVPKSTANNIFNHAVQNAVAKRKRLEEGRAGSAGDGDAAASGDGVPADPDKASDFLAGIDDELNSLYSRECIVEKEKKAAAEVPIAEQVSLVELLAPDCLDPHPRPGRPRVAPEEKARRKKEKKEAVAASRLAKQTPAANAEQDTASDTTTITTTTPIAPPPPPPPEREADNRWVNYNFTDDMQIEAGETFGGPLVWGDCIPESC